MRYKKACHSCRTTGKCSESAQESGELRYISDHQSINQFSSGFDDCSTKQVACIDVILSKALFKHFIC